MSRLVEAATMLNVETLRLSFPEFADVHLELSVQLCTHLEGLCLVDNRVTRVFIRGLSTALGTQLKRHFLQETNTNISFDAVQ